jgi:hypothetical protein
VQRRERCLHPRNRRGAGRIGTFARTLRGCEGVRSRRGDRHTPGARRSRARIARTRIAYGDDAHPARVGASVHPLEVRKLLVDGRRIPNAGATSCADVFRTVGSGPMTIDFSQCFSFHRRRSSAHP